MKKKQKEGFWKKIRGGVFYTLVTIFLYSQYFLYGRHIKGEKILQKWQKFFHN